MAEHNDFGKEAENFAANYLQKLGYAIVARNYRYQKAELDLITRLGDLLVVVEVKARQHDTMVAPQSAVDRKKIQRIILATDDFLNTYPDDVEVRFDIISILKTPQQTLELTHIKNAFESVDF